MVVQLQTGAGVAGVQQVTVSPEFREFFRDRLECVRREKRERALALARRGLHTSTPPPGDLDAISVPDVATPDSGLAAGDEGSLTPTPAAL